MWKEYKLGFDRYGLLLFLLIMLPNFIWFAVPAPNDALRTDALFCKLGRLLCGDCKYRHYIGTDRFSVSGVSVFCHR